MTEPSRRIQRVMLAQPNFAWLGRRTWKLLPYNLGLLNAHLKRAGYDSWIYDPNFAGLAEDVVREELRRTRPDVVGITTFSTEYLHEPRRMSQLVKEELPNATVILGGILPTVLLEKALEDPNVDYFVLGEGEYRLPRLLDALNTGSALDGLDGLAWGRPAVVQPPEGFISDLDGLEYPDYGDLDVAAYGNHLQRYAHTVMPRQTPFATTVTSRGCPYHCTFCAASTVSGRKIRLRSAQNVLAELDRLRAQAGIREIIFADDHFLANRARVVEILRGLIERDWDLTWKCVNVNVMCLDEELLQLMRESGCYQITVSIESGDATVLRDIVKKPMDLTRVPGILDSAKRLGFEVAANFVFGFPGETWDQIRTTCRYAERLSADLINFHIAAPLPQTELMDVCQREGLLVLGDSDDQFGYTKGVIATPEFSPMELQVLRAFEWDRINFSTPERKATIARMEGISLEELEEWRVRTRRALGTTVGWKD